jgi:hypothetical protein
MKSFYQFLTEATQSQAASQAKKLGLRGDGHGGWVDRAGKVVARTDQGKLKFIGDRGGKGAEQPSGGKKSAAPAAPMAQPKTAAQAPAPEAPPKAEAPATEKKPEEASTITIVFGRFNPPTIGHEKLLKSAKRISVGGDIKIYPSRTQDPKKNPLSPDAKITYMKKMFPDFEETIVSDPYMKSIFDVLTAAGEEGYGNVNIVVGSDRQAEFENLAQKYNGELYNFDSIRVVTAGVIDADSASGAEGLTSSRMRKAAMDGDLKTFRRGVPKTLDDKSTETLFNAVRKGMNLKKLSKSDKVKNESYALWEIAPKYDMKNLRENYINGNIFNIGNIVQNLNTGLVGEIVRRGTNHLICVTEDGHMFKSWIKDLMEYTEVSMDRMYREPGKPNTLVGTSGYLKYAVKQTPGSTLGKENIQPGGQAFLNFINKYKKQKVRA